MSISFPSWPQDSASRKSVSDALGAISILCWLFAQFPQLVENYRNGSVDGLALPFLLSWLFGDIANLVGCLLTDQLPFQICLAAYFCFCDFVLISQFVHYTLLKRKYIHNVKPIPEIERDDPNLRRNPSKGAYRSNSTQRTQRRSNPITSGTMTASWPRDRSLSPRTLKRMSISRRESHPSKKHDLGVKKASSHNATSAPTILKGNIPLSADIDNELRMLESFTSEVSHKSTSTTVTLPRGRKTSRPNAIYPATSITLPDMRQSSNSNSRDRAPGKVMESSQDRTRSVVFLSIWVLAGLSKFTLLLPTTPEPFSTTANAAQLFSASQAWIASSMTSPYPGVSTDFHVPASSAMALQNQTLQMPLHVQRDNVSDHSDPPLELNYQHVVGRISAWICVVFYLTSRMPQIWKNFRRRSVEGLSVLLFIAAFHGNLFYVLSVVTSPLVQEQEGYLLESFPFLLGSGGTLAFDMVILFQSFIYARRSIRNKISRKPLIGLEGAPTEIAGLLGEEEEGIVGDDAQSVYSNT